MNDKSSGFSLKELVDQLSRIYKIDPTKRFKRQVAVALRRGVNYGILVKSRNKYRFDPETALQKSLKKRVRKRKRKVKVRKVRATPIARKCTTMRAMKGTKTPKKQIKPTKQTQPQKSPPNVPRPTVPAPPNWQPKPRNLITEPFIKVIKHPRSKNN